LPYILTAGHCVTEPIYKYPPDPIKTAWYVDHSAHQIGLGHNTSYFYNTGAPKSGDAGIVSISYPNAVNGQWGPLHAWVLVRWGSCEPGGCPAPTYDEQYYMSDYIHDIDQAINDRVCTTGTTTGSSDCGRVSSTYNSVDYGTEGMDVDGQSHHWIYGIAKTNVCNAPGDSGGPVYAGHIAYGTQSGYTSNACAMTYYPILWAGTDLNIHLAVGT
jgi:hypothetical protein